jgi:ribosomal-protein-alanine N-acetyltransferase
LSGDLPRGPAARKARVPTFPELDTERLHLRALTDDDAPWYLTQFSRAETIEGQGYAPPDGIAGAIEEMREYGAVPFEEGRGVRWAICVLGADGTPAPTPIGTCALLEWEDEPISRAELGYSLEPAHWGRGYATEAIEAIQRFGFDVMGLDHIEALVWEHNERSIRVLERLGYRRDAFLPESHRDATGTMRNEWRYVLERPKTEQ